MNRIRLLILYTVVTLFLIAITATAGYFCLRQNIHVVNMKSNYATTETLRKVSGKKESTYIGETTPHLPR